MQLNSILSRRSVALLAFVCAGVVSAGCGTVPLGQIGSFGKAARALSEGATEALSEVDQTTIDRKMYDVAADASLRPNGETFRGLFEDKPAAGATPRDKSASNALAVRLKLLKQLTDYSAALEELATKDFRSGIDEASKDLYGSLVGMKDTYKKASNGKELKVSQETLAIVSTAVDAIGTAIAEDRRRKAVKAVIEASDDAVQQAATLISKELAPGGPIADQVTTSLNDMTASLDLAYATAATQPGSTFETRLAQLRTRLAAERAAAQSPELFDNISNGAAKLGKTHAALKKAVQKNQFASAELAGLIGELADYGKSIKKFHDSLKKE